MSAPGRLASRTLSLALALACGFGMADPSRSAAAGTPGSTLRVFAAASLSSAFGEIARLFESRHAAVSVQLETGCVVCAEAGAHTSMTSTIAMDSRRDSMGTSVPLSTLLNFV